MMMKNLPVLLYLIFILQSCSVVPGQYLSKHDPGFYSNKGEANVQVAVEQSGIRNGIAFNGNIAFSKHFFAGLNTGVYKQILIEDNFQMKGIAIRPQLGMFFDFGADDAMYMELHIGVGQQFNNYSLFDYTNKINYKDRSRPTQIFGGAFMGCRMGSKKIGFDMAYEYNHFNRPTLRQFRDLPGGEYADPIDVKDPIDFINSSINFTTSFYVMRSVKNVDIFFNPGLNIGYTAAFLRLGVVWKL